MLYKEKIAYKRGYRVTKEGILLNPNGKEIGTLKSDGYIRFVITIEGKAVSINTSRLQAYIKFGEKLYTKGIVVRHLNSIKTDNSWANITLGTMSENAYDRPKAERDKIARIASSFMQKHSHIEVQDYYKQSGSRQDTMNHFGITSTGTFHYIINNQK